MKILVTGSSGMLGKNLLPKLLAVHHEVIPLTSRDVDLRNEEMTVSFVKRFRPDCIIHLAARVGGIAANIEGGEKFFRENIEIDQSVFKAAIQVEVSKLIYMGSSCMFPSTLNRPMLEEDLWTGPLEKTNEPYAVSKLLGTRFVQSVAITEGLSWRTLITSNLYGPHDHFGSLRSHLIAAVIDRIYKAKISGVREVEMWGDGTPRREFTFVEDVASFIADNIMFIESFPPYMNIGVGEDHEVIHYYHEIASILGYEGSIIANRKKPNGTMRKLMDSSRAHSLGWLPKTKLREVLISTVNFYQEMVAKVDE